MSVYGPRTKPWRLAVEDALGLEVGERCPARRGTRPGRGLGPRVALEKLADDLIELAAVDQVAAPQVPDEPFASAEFGGHHGSVVSFVEPCEGLPQRWGDGPGRRAAARRGPSAVGGGALNRHTRSRKSKSQFAGVKPTANGFPLRHKSVW